MRLSLTIRLTFAFLVVALVTASLVFISVRSTRVSQFQSLLAEQETAVLADEIRSYYNENGSLAGFPEYLHSLLQAEGREQHADGFDAPVIPQHREHRDPPFRGPFGVVSVDGTVLIPTERYRPGERVPVVLLQQSTPVIVDIEPVAFIVQPDPQISFRLRAEEQAYLERTNQALLLATIGAVLVAMLLGAVFARTLTRPIRDLTDAAQALRRGNLGQQVSVRSQDELGQLASTFNKMSADLERATYARRQMTADIAHDLRTPLQVIGGYIDAMVEGDLEPTRERLVTVYTEIEHLQHLVADLRILSRADAGDLPLNLQPVSAAELLHRVAATYGNEAVQQSIKLTTSTAPDLPPLCIDEERMVQVLSNLVSNALRHTPAGGCVALTACQDDAGVCLTVQDNGEGIAAHDLPYLFDRFYRVDRSRQEDAGASGLGLAIAKALVEAHGGTIAARSPGPGQGATFLLTLPCM